MNRRIVKIGALLTVIFGSGIVVGFVLNTRFRPAPAPALSQPAPVDPEQRVELRMKEFTERLKLTTNQQQVIRPILQGHVAEVQRMNAIRFRRGREVFEQTSSKIRQQLTPEQQKTYDEMLKQIGKMRTETTEEK